MNFYRDRMFDASVYNLTMTNSKTKNHIFSATFRDRKTGCKSETSIPTIVARKLIRSVPERLIIGLEDLESFALETLLRHRQLHPADNPTVGWLITFAENRTRDYIIREMRKVEHVDSLDGTWGNCQPSGDGYLTVDLRDLIEGAELSNFEFEAVCQYVFLGKTFSEIGKDQKGVSKVSAKKAYDRGIAIIASDMDKRDVPHQKEKRSKGSSKAIPKPKSLASIVRDQLTTQGKPCYDSDELHEYLISTLETMESLAIQQDVPFSFGIDDFAAILTRDCPITAEAMYPQGKSKATNDWTFRPVVPNLGYVPSNVVLVSREGSDLWGSALLPSQVRTKAKMSKRLQEASNRLRKFLLEHRKSVATLTVTSTAEQARFANLPPSKEPTPSFYSEESSLRQMTVPQRRAMAIRVGNDQSTKSAIRDRIRYMEMRIVMDGAKGLRPNDLENRDMLHCPALGYRLRAGYYTWEDGKPKVELTMRDPSLGWAKGNVFLCSAVVDYMRRDMTPDQFDGARESYLASSKLREAEQLESIYFWMTGRHMSPRPRALCSGLCIDNKQ